MEKEIWKDICGYEGRYAISNYGRVKSFVRKTKNDGILSLHSTREGYKLAQLYKCGKAKFILVHRLVAEAFIPNPNAFEFVNHIDEDKHNNSANNLEWCTKAYNTNYGKGAEQRRMSIRKAWEKPFICIETGNIYTNVVDCSREMGIERRSIAHVLHNRQRTTHGYHFKYVERARKLLG